MRWRILIVMWGVAAIFMSSDGAFLQFNLIELLTFAFLTITTVIAIAHTWFVSWYKRGFTVAIKREQDSRFIHVIIESQSVDDFEIFVREISGVVEEEGNEPRTPWNLPWRNGLHGSKTISITPDMPEAANLLRVDEKTFQAFSTSLYHEGWTLTSPNPNPLYDVDSKVVMEIKIRGKLARRIQDWRVIVSHGDPPQIEEECIGNYRRWR